MRNHTKAHNAPAYRVQFTRMGDTKIGKGERVPGSQA